jgi:hypothetical protein
MIRSAFRRPIAVALAATMFGGCYRFDPTIPGTVSPETEMRLELTPLASLTLTPSIGTNVSALDGFLVDAGADSIALRVVRAAHPAGEDTPWRGERVAFPRSFVANFGVKKLSVARSILLGTSVTVAAGIAAGLMVTGYNSNPRNSGSAPAR